MDIPPFNCQSPIMINDDAESYLIFLLVLYYYRISLCMIKTGKASYVPSQGGTPGIMSNPEFGDIVDTNFIYSDVQRKMQEYLGESKIHFN